MEYEDKNLESALRETAKNIQPSRAAAWRMLNVLPVGKKPLYWMLGVVVPAMAILVFVLVQNHKPQEEEIMQEQVYVDQELAEVDGDFFEGLDLLDDESMMESL